MRSQVLPIDSELPNLLDQIQKQPSVILVAPPGTGKTTRVPPFFAASEAFKNKQILVLEPRRLAAKLSAQRVAAELGEEPGKTVGYVFRSESRMGPETRIVYMTEGTFTRRLLRDPQLQNVGLVILDEFHERHLQGDLALAFVNELQTRRRPDLKLLVMSATLDTESLAKHLGNPSLVKLESPLHPVVTEYLQSQSEKLEERVHWGVHHARKHQEGSILVFLPGISEIRRCEERLRQDPQLRDAEILGLHSSYSKEEQEKALSPSNNFRIILSTNLAETSVTVPGVRIVLDSGFHRQATSSSWSGIGELKTRRISKASAIQRGGRAGRLGPGFCLRLYSKAEFDSLLPFETAEVHRVDLGPALLEVKRFGMKDPRRLPWLETPTESRLLDAARLLHFLGATQSEEVDAELTERGRRMSEIPLAPRSARALIEAQERGAVPGTAGVLAALELGLETQGDRGLEDFAAKKFFKNPLWERESSRLANLISKTSNQSSEAQPETLRRALLAGFLDRLGKAEIRDRKLQLVLAGGGRAEVDLQHWMEGRSFFLVLSASEGSRSGLYRVGALTWVKPEWLWDLEPWPLKEIEGVAWRSDRKRVESFRRLCVGSIVLEEESLGVVPSPQSTRLLVQEALGLNIDQVAEGDLHHQWSQWSRILAGVVDPEDFESLLARIVLKQPDSSNSLTETILGILGDVAVLEDLKKIDLSTRAREWLGFEAWGRLEKDFPSRLRLPSGRETKIQYRFQQGPWVASRLQDFFGMQAVPALGGGVPLTLHLLAPNQRPVQVTQDLKSFWTNTYPQVRKELMRRYPRHKWPENPLKPES